MLLESFALSPSEKLAPRPLLLLFLHHIPTPLIIHPPLFLFLFQSIEYTSPASPASPSSLLRRVLPLRKG